MFLPTPYSAEWRQMYQSLFFYAMNWSYRFLLYYLHHAEAFLSQNRSTEENTLDLSGLPKSSRDNIQVALEKQVLIVSLGAKLKVTKCKDIRDWFMANEFADFGDPFTNFFLSRRLPKGFVDDASVQKKVIEYFASFDEHIKDFEIEKLPHDADSKEETYKISSYPFR